MSFPNNVPLSCRVVMKNVSSEASFISRYEIVTSSTKVLNNTMRFENVRW